MAKHDDFEMGSEFDDFQSDFEDFDFDIDENAEKRGSREPASRTKQLATAGLDGVKSNITKKLISRMGYQMPNTQQLLGDATQILSDGQRLRDDFVRDITPGMLQLKRAGQVFFPRVKSYLPDKVGSKIENFLKTENRSGGLSLEEERRSLVNENLENIFKLQVEQDQETKKEAKLDTFVDRTLASGRHKESAGLLDSIRIATEFNKNYLTSVDIAYRRKRLELAYDHLFVAKDTRELIKGLSQVIETNLKDISHNTALPDIQKQQLSESYKEVMRGAVSNRINQHLSGWVGQIGKNIKSRVLDPVVQGVNMAAGAAEMTADFAQMEEELGMSSAPSSPFTLLGKAAGGGLTSLLGKKLTTKLFGSAGDGLISPYAGTLEGWSGQAKLKAMLKVKELQENLDPSSPIGFLTELLSSGVSRDAGTLVNTAAKPEDLASYDVAARTSIVEIMPGYLARAVQLLSKIATGKDTSLLTYDYTKRDFVTSGQLRKRVIEEAFGTEEQRSEDIGRAVGAIRGLYGHLGEDVVQIDNAAKDIATFIINSATKKYLLAPNTIRKYLNEEELSDSENNYISRTSNGIKDSRAFFTILNTILYPDGKSKYIDAETEINRYIIGLMQKDEYLDVLPRYLNATGQASLFTDLATSTGDRFQFNQETIQKLLHGDLGKSFIGSLENESNYTQNKFNNLVQSVQNAPESVRQLFESVSGNRAALSISDTKLPGFTSSLNPLTSTYEMDPTGVRKSPFSGITIPKATENRNDESVTSIIPVKIAEVEGLLPTYLKKSDIDFTSIIKLKDPQVTKSSTQLEDIAEMHFERQFTVPDLLERIAESSGEMNDKLMSLLADGITIFGQLYHKGKRLTIGGLKRLKSQALSIPKGLKDLGEDAYLHGLYGLDWVKEKIPGLKPIYDKGKKYLGDKWDGTKRAAKNIGWGMVDAGLGLGDMMLSLPEAVGQGFTMARDGFAKVKSNIAARWKIGQEKARKTKRFVDVYRKDEVEIGKPLLSAKKQISGVVFNDGSAVRTSYRITKPVIDPEDGTTYITQEDIEHGLVDVENNSLTPIGIIKGIARTIDTKLLGGAFGKAKSLLGGLFGKDSFLRKILSGGLKGLGNLFTKGPLQWMTSFNSKITKKELKSLVGDKLDLIYNYLVARFGNVQQKLTALQVRAGDSDGDGKRDSIFEEKQNRLKEEQHERIEDREERQTEALEAIRNALTPKKKKSKNEDEGGLVSGLLDLVTGGKGKGGGFLSKWGGKLLGALGLGGAAAGGATAASAVGAGGALATLGSTATAAGTALASGVATTATATGGLLAGSGTTLAALASNPIGWVIGGTLAVGAGAYLGYRYLNPSGDSLIDARAQAYGIDLNASTGLFTGSNTKRILELEERTAAIVEGRSNPLNDSDMEYFADLFGFDRKIQNQVAYFASWYRQRFYPSFRIFLNIIKNAGFTYSSIDDITEEFRKPIADEFLKQTSGHVNALRNLVPTMQGYKTFEKMQNIPQSEENKAQAHVAVNTEKVSNNEVSSRTQKYKVDPSISEVTNNLPDPKPKKRVPSDTSPGGAGFWTGFYGGQETLDAMETVDTSNYKPELPKSGELGAISAQFESSKKGSLAIGYDATGGTSYGKYQLASRTGTFGRFLSWLETQGPSGQEIVRRLRNANGPYDTGSTSGAVPNEWRKLVIEGKLKNYEHQFIKLSHYDPALQGLPSELRALVLGSKALQDVLWSTAVQHGPSGAVKIFREAYGHVSSNGQVRMESLIKEIYADRKDKFPSSTARVQAAVRDRFKKESSVALAMLATESASPDVSGEDIVASEATKSYDEEPMSMPTAQETGTTFGTKRTKVAVPEQTPTRNVVTASVETKPQKNVTSVTPQTANTSIDLTPVVAILTQMKTGIDQLVSGNVVLGEIRDGLASGFNDMVTLAKSNSSTTSIKHANFQQRASMSRSGISVTRQKAYTS
jgi:hypothetical protein